MFEPKLAFELGPSRYLAILLASMHGGALIIVMVLTLLWWLKVGLILLCLISFAFQYCQHVLRKKSNAIVKVWKTEKEDWQVQDKRGQVWTARLCNDSVCTLYFALLNFRLVNKKTRRSIVVLPDSLDSVSFRHLRVFFKN